MTTALCIGNGASLSDWEDYIVYNKFDIRIGTKLHITRPEFDLDYVVAADLPPVQYILEHHPEWHNRLVTRQLWQEKLCSEQPNLKLICPKTFTKGDVTGTLAVKYAIEQGATSITTVAFDSLAGSWRKDTVWEWSSTIDPQIMKQQQIEQKRKRLLDTWRDQIVAVEKQNPHVEFRHFNVNKNEKTHKKEN